MFKDIKLKFQLKIDEHPVLHLSYKTEKWLMCQKGRFSKIRSHIMMTALLEYITMTALLEYITMNCSIRSFSAYKIQVAV